MKKKNGFTLIELLAVILILGIIALIAIPTVNTIIKDSKKGAFKSSVQNIVSAVETKCQLDQMKSEAHNGTYTFTSSGVTPKLDVKGTLPTSGTIEVDDTCKVTSVNVSDGTFTAVIEKDEIKINEGEGSSSTGLAAGLTIGTAVYVNPETKTICDEASAVSTTGTKTGCMKWYVYKDNGNGTYQLILDHNTTAGVAYNSGNVNTSMKEVATALTSDTSTWNTSLNARLIKADEVAAITNNTTFNSATTPDTGWFYFETNTVTEPSPHTTKYGWLYDYTNDCTTYGCNIADSSTYGYWTDTAVSGSTIYAWSVTRNGSLLYSYATSTNYGVRPVITF